MRQQPGFHFAKAGEKLGLPKFMTGNENKPRASSHFIDPNQYETGRKISFLIVTLFYSPDLPESEASFAITIGGVDDAKE